MRTAARIFFFHLKRRRQAILLRKRTQTQQAARLRYAIFMSTEVLTRGN